MDTFAYILAFVWGVLWALCLQLTGWGKFLARRRTWLAVVIGVGADLLILLPILPLDLWMQMVAIVALSAVGIVVRSVYNEYTETREEMDRARRASIQ